MSNKTSEECAAWYGALNEEDFELASGKDGAWQGVSFVWQACAASHAQEVKRLREALRKLEAEISELHIEAVRDSLGNTNAAILSQRAEEARAALQGDGND